MLSGMALAPEDCTLLSLIPEVVSLVGVDDCLGITVLVGLRLILGYMKIFIPMQKDFYVSYLCPLC